jgi:hypothetical protein
VLWLLACVGAVAAVFVAGLALLLGALFIFGGHFGGSTTVGRQHLQPIPISRSACPYVKAMHTAAYNFEVTNPVIFGGSDVGNEKTSQDLLNALTDSRRWPAFKARVDHSIVVLDHSLRDASPHLPKQVQDKLAITHESLHLGRIQLHKSKSGLDLFSGSISDINRRGQYAFGDASDLIGMACGVHVGV